MRLTLWKRANIAQLKELDAASLEYPHSRPYAPLLPPTAPNTLTGGLLDEKSAPISRVVPAKHYARVESMPCEGDMHRVLDDEHSEESQQTQSGGMGVE